MDMEKYKITSSEEYHKYLKALCRLASHYVSRIRVQFAEKAFDKYQDETIRKLVIAYGEQAEKLDETRLRDFCYVSEYGAATTESLNDSCLNNAGNYGQSIKFLFEID